MKGLNSQKNNRKIHKPWGTMKKVSAVGLTTLLVMAKGTAPVIANSVRSRFSVGDTAIVQIHEDSEEEVPLEHYIGHEDGTQIPMTDEETSQEIKTDEGYIGIVPLTGEQEEDTPPPNKGPHQDSAHYVQDVAEELGGNPWTIVTPATLATGILLVAAGGFVLKKLLKP